MTHGMSYSKGLCQRRLSLRRLSPRVLHIIELSRMLFCDYSFIHGSIKYQVIFLLGSRDHRRDCSNSCMYFCSLSLLSNRPSPPSFPHLQLRRHHPRDGTWCDDHTVDGRLPPWLQLLQLRRLPPEDGNRLGHSSGGRPRRQVLGDGLRGLGLCDYLRR